MRKALATVAALVTFAAGYVVLDVYDVAPGVLTLRPVATPAPVPTGSATSGQASAYAVATGAPLEALDPSAPVPTRAALKAELEPLVDDAALVSSSVVVRDALTGKTVLDLDGARTRIPASTTKLLTAAAVDATLDGSTTLVTKVVEGPGSGQVTLVAGGDSLLDPGAGSADSVAGRAGLADLADQVAAALSAAGRDSVRLGLDLSFAEGPLVAPTWPASYRATGITGAVAMLGLSSQRATVGDPGPADPPAQVAARFAELLRRRGIAVTGTVTDASATASAEVLGQVESAPVRDVLALALDESDNGLTETLARIAAYTAGAKTDFAGTAAFVRATVRSLGVDVSAVRLVDTSGLSREDRLTARVLADVLDIGLSGDDAGLSQTLADLAVAGLSGTLEDRFEGAAVRPALGMVRGKTGTLTGVSGLAGSVLTADGRVLTFVVLATTEPTGEGTVAGRAVIDRIAATLAGCGCR